MIRERWQRYWRQRRETKLLATASHRGWTLALLEAHASVLERRLRQPHMRALADRVVDLDPSTEAFADVGDRPQVLLDRLLVATRSFIDEERALTQGFADFAAAYGRAGSEAVERRLMIDHLTTTVRDPRARQADIAALDRHLAFDALRERSAAAILRASATAEVGLSIWGRAVAASMPAPRTAWASATLEAAVGVAAQALATPRWQVRLCGLEAAVAVAGAYGALDDTPRPALLEALAAIEATALDHNQHAWIQARALELLVLCAPARGRARLLQRLFTPSFDQRADFLVRRLAIDLAGRRLPAVELMPLLRRLVERPDPSEAVRMMMADAIRQLPLGDAVVALAGDATRPLDPSFRVRATTAIALRRLGTAALAVAPPDAAATVGVVEGLCRYLAAERAPFTLGVMCEELAELVGEIEASTLSAEVRATCASHSAATLAAVVRDEAIFPRAAEAAAAALDAITRDRTADRRALTTALATEIGRIPAGHRRTFSIARWPARLQAAVREHESLGRVLADLARRDWGLDVRVRGDRLTVWRGDRFRRRAWRVLHELRNPAPNKRQAFRHTVGRAYAGAVRAHPGNLDEATATTVPGERVAVDSEGSWCRHLPLVDDLLDLPLRGGSVDVASSFGIARIHAPPTLRARLRARVVLSRRYRTWANLRLASLRATEPRERRRYLEAAAQELGIRVEFLPLRDETHALALHGSVRTLFPEPAVAVTALATLGPLTAAREWLASNSYYFGSATENSQRALTLFLTGLTSVFVARGYQKRRQIEAARAAVPLTIGGWGTRGKSGTERLKAAMFDGLGFNVFVKTTGCEAMFIHSAPLQKPVEIFIYRPYDKATIWEQMNMIRLASRLHADVFMWECMALNPKYVQLLQHDWMRDDLVTLTNSYPDHEDIQGPVGFNVAQVITEFIPKRSTLITSEMQYLPLFADRARARGTTMYAITDRDAELISDEVLDLFPYREHPRNIALVGRMAEELGLERSFAQILMAANVVPDLGVLKAYPRCRVRGRYLTFVCGNSANERTGFINNWRRMKCDQLSMTDTPTKLVVTVVNNRADRVSRSEVFARILVRDVAFDRHVLIGTNLKGLRGFLNVALADYLGELQLVVSDDFASDAPATMPLTRLDRELGNLRIPAATADALLLRIASYARHAELDPAPAEAPLRGAIDRLLVDAAADLSLASIRRQVDGDAGLTAALEAMPTTPPAELDPPESVEPATKADVLEHARIEIARVMLRARLERAIRGVAEGRQGAAAASFQAAFNAAYTEAFWAQIVVIDDAGASGDQIIDRCARAVPPGSDVVLMGTQNIKGTGLDFVYRWLALDAVVLGIAQLQGTRLDDRGPALTELEAFADHGLVDAGYARVALTRPIAPPLTVDQEAARQRILAKCQAVYERRKAGLTAAKQAGWQQKAAAYVEGAVDYLDSIYRTKAAGHIIDDLVAMRISHNRASIEMRDLVGRLKGGWLYKGVQKRLTRKR